METIFDRQGKRRELSSLSLYLLKSIQRIKSYESSKLGNSNYGASIFSRKFKRSKNDVFQLNKSLN